MLAIVSIVSAQTQEDKTDRIIASYLLAFGVLPEQGEIDYWMNSQAARQSVGHLYNEHKKSIQSNTTLRDRAIINSYQDALGKTPVQVEIDTWRPLHLSYVELVERHLKFLNDYPDEFRKMIKLTYRREFDREAKKQEVDDWASWGVRAYYSIIQEHQKNKKAGMFSEPPKKIKKSKKSGVQVNVSPKTITEIQHAMAGVIATGGGNVIATGGGNVIATGGGNVIATGGLN